MEGLLILIPLALIVFVIVLPVAAILRAGDARRKAEQLQTDVIVLREQNARLKERLDRLEGETRVPRTAAPSAIDSDVRFAPSAASKPAEIVMSPPVEKASPPPIPPPVAKPQPVEVMHASVSSPAVPQRSTVEPRTPINLEQFMGAKLFAWVGGLALFLGVLFFVKLSIERGWISPELRSAIGFAVGIGLVAGGAVMHRRARYATLAHTLCATGIVVLYGVTFAAHQLWSIRPLNQPLIAFLLMSLITGAAFLLAVRMNAQVVAVLGMLGGFLTPILCSAGKDNPFGLFSYIALLDIGVLAVAKNKRWLHLTPLAAAGTILMQAGWLLKFFRSSHYAIGTATWVPVSVFLGFATLFMLAVWWSRQREDEDAFPAGSALALCGSAIAAAFLFLTSGTITERPLLLYTFVLGLNVVVMLVVWQQTRLAIAQSIFAMLTFLHLSIWTANRLTAELLPQALGIYLVFGLLLSAFAVLLERKSPALPTFAGWTPILSLVLLLLPVLWLDGMNLMVWPVILIVDLLVIGFAIASGQLLPVLAALVLTLITAGAWLFRWPKELGLVLAPFLFVVGGFAVLFGLAGSFLFRKRPQAPFVSLLPVSSAVLPFLLLILATLQLRIANPSAVFGLALLLALFLLGLARITGVTVLAPTALGCVIALEGSWHLQSFEPGDATLALLWYLGFHAVFTAFPFVFRANLATRKLPWIASAASGIGTFCLVYRLVDQTWPNEVMGLLPAAFAIVPLLGLWFVAKQHPVTNPARLTQLAWFGGVGLLFIALIFPIQFEKQWITLGWAVYALTLLVIGLWKCNAPTRYAGIGLLAVTVLKLFLLDLANIDSGYRIAALIGVALIALAASFLYQRFFSGEPE